MLENRRNRRGRLSIKSEKAEANNFAPVQQDTLPTESRAEGINAFSIVGAEREGRMLRGSLLTPGRRGASQHRPRLPSMPSGVHSNGLPNPAGLLGVHGPAFGALKRLAELLEVLDGAIHAHMSH
jgi:hypothetical protein